MQNSDKFQFDQRLLQFLFDSAHDSRFGTFYGDSHKDREKYLFSFFTPSIWWYILEPENRRAFEIPREIHADTDGPLLVQNDCMSATLHNFS